MDTSKNIPIMLFLVGLLLNVNPILMAQEASGPTTDVRALEAGKPIERALADKEIHTYDIRLDSGQFLRTAIEQRGIDVVVIVFGPDGQKITEIDGTGTEGSELVEVAAKVSGIYRLDVRVFDEIGAGRYEITIEQLLTPEQYVAYLTAERARNDAARQWLATNAIKLRTVEAGQGFADMQPLKKLIGTARVVALGEATHGTREFFQIKHRMLEFLVTEMGFTIFGIEATMPEAFDINEYVLTGKGDPAKALAGLYFWTWDTEEVLDMIHWMRRYNADPRHIRKVKFYGFDMQHASRAVKLTLSYLRTVDSEHAVAAEQAFAVLANPYTAGDFAAAPKETIESAATAAGTLLKRFDERKHDYIERTSAAAWALACQHARIVAQMVEMFSNWGTAYTARDSSMAQNIHWILEHEGPDAKMVAWAHNGHVATQPGSMGAHLRKMFGSDMVVFGFAFNQGSFQAVEEPFPSQKGLHPFHVGPAPEGSLDFTLAAADLRLAVVDLHALPQNGPVAEWFSTPHLTRNIGAGYSEQSAANYLQPEVVSRKYDALLFVETTTTSRGVAGGQHSPPLQRRAIPANVDFETGELGKPPVDWIVPPGTGNFDFFVTTSEENPYNGKHSAMISRAPGRHYGEEYGRLEQWLDATPYRGKQIKLSAAIRTDVTGPGNQAYLWLRVMKGGAVAFHDNMADRPIITREWREYEIVGDVPLDAESISYGFAFVGDGRVWVDAMSVEVIDK